MYNHVLIPTDGSDESEAAVDHGIAIAAPHDATVHLIHVIDIGTEMSASGSGQIADELTETLNQEAENALTSAEQQAKEADVTYERMTREGIPHEVVVEYTSENDIDLIVMGASGRSGLKEHLLGSTTDRVIRSVDTAVLLTRP